MTAERLRDQCPQCPWRNVANEVSPVIVEYANTRLGPCDGPRIALKLVR